MYKPLENVKQVIKIVNALTHSISFFPHVIYHTEPNGTTVNYAVTQYNANTIL